MVGIVIIHRRAAPGALELKAAAHAGICLHAPGEILSGHAQKDGHSSGSKGVIQVMLARHPQLHAAVMLAVVFHIKVIQAVLQPDIHRPHVAILAHTKIQHPLACAFGDPAAVGVIAVHHQHAAFRHQVRKLPEGTDHVLQIGKKVGMIHFHIQNHTNGGGKLQKGVLILAAFCHKQITVPDAQRAANAGQLTAHHHGGIQPRLHGKGGDHRGGGGLTVGTRYANGVGIPAHDQTPSLRPADDRNTGRHRSCDFGIGIGNRRRADHQTHTLHIFRKMSHRYRNAGLAQMLGRGRLHTVRALHLSPQMHQHFCQRPHGNAADAHQMDGATGVQYLIKQFICHRRTPPFPCAR